MTKGAFLLSPGVTTGIAICLLALAAGSGLDVGRDFQRQSAARHAQSQKQQLALLGQLELGHAVQDFKDCLLRAESSYCEDFHEHIQSVDRNLTLYGAQRTEHPDEKKALEALRRSLPAYESALEEVRNMQSRHATIQEIDSVVRGVDRPVADELRTLATLSSTTSAGWTVPLGPALFLLTSAALAGFFLFLTVGSSQSRNRRSDAATEDLSPLLNHMFEWEEHGKARAFARLHDEVCQSLSAVLYFLESLRPIAVSPADRPLAPLPAAVIPTLRAALQDTRSVAVQLRPARIQEGGLLATLQSSWIDTRVLNPQLTIESCARLHENDIPPELKPVILRIGHMIAEFATEYPEASRVAWLLERDGHVLRLAIELSVEGEAVPQFSSDIGSADGARALSNAIHAQVVLSGGRSELISNRAGSGKIVCTWFCDG